MAEIGDYEIGDYNRQHDMEMARRAQEGRRQQQEQLIQEIQDRQDEDSEFLPPPPPLQRQVGDQYANYNELHDRLMGQQGGRRKRRTKRNRKSKRSNKRNRKSKRRY